jgi:hypothetical protein
MLGQFAGVSFAEKAGFSEGVEAKAERIKPVFAKAAENNILEKPELLTTDIPVSKGPKVKS